MLDQAIQPALATDMTPSSDHTVVSPFEDIANVHALYEQRIFRFLLLSLRDRDLAHTITQDTFLKAWKARDSFRGECSIATWLTRIAINLLRDHTRTETFRFWKRVAVEAVSADDLATQLRHPAQSTENVMIAKERLAEVWSNVQLLSARQRTIFLLRYVDELELSEIATATDLPLATVKSHLYRALDSLRTNNLPASRKRGKK
ncbi:RNA polymerase sigma factor [Terriglobus saanensis]|uniref:RNA polymerase, sigma-24 subunit, ECF subfamily n=1 Tax=Terriglobus saanensis (strain ATCC BAA-1853 / DSM 23119 / SP1PR4) TaxID=401053 RepID=E8V5J5_TERSS|nr:RNA polymerase sigma factor [Terriglobus saanensis]ADV81529.1 RNA polymerase, sigma-24 subunit, ECF subfamily [Terriglobus saanensis SP1PR4]